MLMVNVNDAVQSLYDVSKGPYVQKTFSTTARQFIPDLLLQRPPRQFVPDPLLLAEAVGFELTVLQTS
jgi:hypothetical protein